MGADLSPGERIHPAQIVRAYWHLMIRSIGNHMGSPAPDAQLQHTAKEQHDLHAATNPAVPDRHFVFDRPQQLPAIERFTG